MATDLTGAWTLVHWRRVAGDGSLTHPLGEDAQGLLLYTADGRMMVQIVAAGRPKLGIGDPLGGDAEARAGLYSTCLAYWGTYEVVGDEVHHHVEQSLFPDWSGADQVRPLDLQGDVLTLRTPPMQTASGTVVNELAWRRSAS